MTLEELSKIPYNRLLRLKAYTGWVKTWGWTGRYYDEGLLERGEHILVEIRTSPFTKKYVPINLLRELKEYKNGS